MGRPHVLTVYLFEINRPGAVLLDGRHQAVGFDDMVVAVQTVSAYENDGESRPAAAIPMDRPYCSCKLTRTL